MAINLWSVGNPDGLRQVQILIPQVQLWVQATSVLQYNYKLNIVCHQQAKDKDSIFKGRTNITDVSQLNIFSICRLAASMCYRQSASWLWIRCRSNGGHGPQQTFWPPRLWPTNEVHNKAHCLDVFVDECGSRHQNRKLVVILRVFATSVNRVYYAYYIITDALLQFCVYSVFTVINLGAAQRGNIVPCSPSSKKLWPSHCPPNANPRTAPALYKH